MTTNTQPRNPKFRVERFLGFFFLLPSVINVFFLLYSIAGNFIGIYSIDKIEEHADAVFLNHIQSMMVIGIKNDQNIQLAVAYLFFSAIMAFVGIILIIFTNRKEDSIKLKNPNGQEPIKPDE